MHSFKDANDNDWKLSINVATIKRVKNTVLDSDGNSVDLLDAIGGSLIEQLIGNPILLGDILYVLCRDQCVEKNITDESFGEGLAGDCIEDATEAFIQELIEFFPKQKARLLKVAMDKIKMVEDRATEAAMEHLESDEVDKLMNSVLKGIGNSSLNFQGSSV